MTQAPAGTAETVFSPGQIGSLKLRNRVIKTATFEGMTPGGRPSDDLVRHHRELAAGGVGMTTVAYCSVSGDGLTFLDQMTMRTEIVPGLRTLTDAVHSEGAAVSLQLGHAGYFASKEVIHARPIGASRAFNLYGLAMCRSMDENDMQRIETDFARSAEMGLEAGFDAIEIHMGHGYLLSQFLSPFTNRRRDGFGGTLENRLRFPLSVVRAVRRAIGQRAAIVAKVNLSDGFAGGLELGEAVEIARRLEAEGLDALVLSGGFVSKTPFYMMRGDLPVREMVQTERRKLRKVGLALFGHLFVQAYPFQDLFFLNEARKVRQAVDMPLVLLGGVRSLAGMRTAMNAGFEFVAMGRALICEPDLIQRMQGGLTGVCVCEPCNKCVAQMENGGVRCVHPDRLLAAGANSAA